MSKKKLFSIIAACCLFLIVIVVGVIQINASTRAKEISQADAETFVNTFFDTMAVGKPAIAIAENNKITVNSMTYGDEKNIILDCSVDTKDVRSALSPRYDEFLGTDVKKKNGTMFKSALDFKLEFSPVFLDIVKNAPQSTKNCTIVIYDTSEGFKAHATEAVIDCVYGGIKSIGNDIADVQTYKDADGNEHEIKSTNVKKGLNDCFELRYDSKKPDASNWLGRIWNSLKEQFQKNFLEYDRWKTIFTGLWVTIKLTLFSLIIGIVIGFVVAFVRCTYLKNTKHGFFLKFFNFIFQIYLTVIRGTPAMVQIMIIYFVIFMPLGVDKFIAAVICFGLNSGAYVAEIVRGGIMSIDDGQTEAGRSLGFGYMATMFYVIFPQAFKAVLPALANEFVVLLKETSIAFYIGLGDLMYAVNAIRAATYTPFMPLIAAAVIYLIMVLVLSKLVSILERKMRNNER